MAYALATPPATGTFVDAATQILQTLGDIGSSAVNEIEQELAARYGGTVWAQMSPQAKSAAISSAWGSVQQKYHVTPTVLVVGAVLLLLLWRRL